jgi:hypothetical protein
MQARRVAKDLCAAPTPDYRTVVIPANVNGPRVVSEVHRHRPVGAAAQTSTLLAHQMSDDDRFDHCRMNGSRADALPGATVTVTTCLASGRFDGPSWIVRTVRFRKPTPTFPAGFEPATGPSIRRAFSRGGELQLYARGLGVFAALPRRLALHRLDG